MELVNIAIFLKEIGKTDSAIKFLKTASRNAQVTSKVSPIISGALKINKPHLAVYAQEEQQGKEYILSPPAIQNQHSMIPVKLKKH